MQFQWSTEIREKIWKHFRLWFLDVFVIPFSFVVFATVYRAPRMIRKCQDESSVMRRHGFVIKVRISERACLCLLEVVPSQDIVAGRTKFLKFPVENGRKL